MKKVIAKDVLEKYIKKEIDPTVRSVIIDVINLLSKKGYNVIQYIKKVNETRFLVYNPEKCKDEKIEYTIEGKVKKTTINWESYEGFYLPILDLDKNSNPILVEKICAINENGTIKKENDSFKQKIIHELLHLISASNKVIKENGNFIIYTGVNKMILEIDGQCLNYKVEKGNTEINEAMTELLANNIYKELYDKTFYMTNIMKEGMYYPCLNIYYINTSLLRILNLFTCGTNKVDKLLFAYLNNNVKYYVDDLDRKIGISYEVLKFIMHEFQKYMLIYFKNSEQGIKMFKNNIINIFGAISYNLYILLKDAKLEEDAKKEYIKFMKKSISCICMYPLFNLVKNEFEQKMAILDKI